MEDSRPTDLALVSATQFGDVDIRRTLSTLGPDSSGRLYRTIDDLQVVEARWGVRSYSAAVPSIAGEYASRGLISKGCRSLCLCA